MKIYEIIRGRAAIQKVADREGKCYSEIEAAIQEAINLAWAEPTAREYQNAMFPEGKPSPAEFVGRIKNYQSPCNSKGHNDVMVRS